MCLMFEGNFFLLVILLQNVIGINREIWISIVWAQAGKIGCKVCIPSVGALWTGNDFQISTGSFVFTIFVCNSNVCLIKDGCSQSAFLGRNYREALHNPDGLGGSSASKLQKKMMDQLSRNTGCPRTKGEMRFWSFVRSHLLIKKKSLDKDEVIPPARTHIWSWVPKTQVALEQISLFHGCLIEWRCPL